MQTVVNSLGSTAVAGYTAASKADQVSVLINNAMMTAISNFVAQNFGAGKWDRIRSGVQACLIQTETINLVMYAGILLLRHPIVRMFLSAPTAEIYHYSDQYLLCPNTTVRFRYLPYQSLLSDPFTYIHNFFPKISHFSKKFF